MIFKKSMIVGYIIYINIALFMLMMEKTKKKEEEEELPQQRIILI